MLTKLRNVAAAIAAAAVLAGCAHPQLMDSGMPEQTVETKIGAPHAKVALPDGGSRWVYSMQPFGEECWWLTFDRNGNLVQKEEVLNREHFALIKPGVSTEEDVWNLFGKYAEKYTFHLINQTAWMYRFLDDGHFYMACWVQFDTKGVVTEVGYTLDPWRTNDGSIFLF